MNLILDLEEKFILHVTLHKLNQWQKAKKLVEEKSVLSRRCLFDGGSSSHRACVCTGHHYIKLMIAACNLYKITLHLLILLGITKNVWQKLHVIILFKQMMMTSKCSDEIP